MIVLPPVDRDSYGKDTKGAALYDVAVCARVHRQAVLRGIEDTSPTTLAGKLLVDDILRAGSKLDQAITIARNKGCTAGEIASVSELHPTYVAELLEWDSHGPRFL